jgi:hypothetical protein
MNAMPGNHDRYLTGLATTTGTTRQYQGSFYHFLALQATPFEMSAPLYRIRRSVRCCLAFSTGSRSGALKYMLGLISRGKKQAIRFALEEKLGEATAKKHLRGTGIG